MSKLYMHFSFDDVYRCLADLTKNENTYKSIYENKFLGKLKELHDKYGAVFSLYLFNNAKEDGYSLKDVTDSFKSEFEAASSWLKFGFHAEEVETNYNKDNSIDISYSNFCDSILQKLGNTDSIDRFIRLGFFAGTSTNIDTIISAENGIVGLLAADDDRISYYLDENTNTSVIENCGVYDKIKNIILVRSQKRLEDVTSAAEMFAGFEKVKFIGNIKILDVFTHEQVFDERVAENLEECIKWAKVKGYEFIFTQDIAENLKEELLK